LSFSFRRWWINQSSNHRARKPG